MIYVRLIMWAVVALGGWYGLAQAKDFFIDDRKEFKKAIQLLTENNETLKSSLATVRKTAEENAEQQRRFIEVYKKTTEINNELLKKAAENSAVTNETIRIIEKSNEECLDVDMPSAINERL